MEICSRTVAQSLQAGTSKRGSYKVKAENIKKLRIYLEKIKNER